MFKPTHAGIMCITYITIPCYFFLYNVRPCPNYWYADLPLPLQKWRGWFYYLKNLHSVLEWIKNHFSYSCNFWFMRCGRFSTQNTWILTKKYDQKRPHFILSQKMHNVLKRMQIDFQIFTIFSFWDMVNFMFKIFIELEILTTASVILFELNSETLTNDTR